MQLQSAINNLQSPRQIALTQTILGSGNKTLLSSRRFNPAIGCLQILIASLHIIYGSTAKQGAQIVSLALKYIVKQLQRLIVIGLRCIIGGQIKVRGQVVGIGLFSRLQGNNGLLRAILGKIGRRKVIIQQRILRRTGHPLIEGVDSIRIVLLAQIVRNQHQTTVQQFRGHMDSANEVFFTGTQLPLGQSHRATLQMRLNQGRVEVGCRLQFGHAAIKLAGRQKSTAKDIAGIGVVGVVTHHALDLGNGIINAFLLEQGQGNQHPRPFELGTDIEGILKLIEGDLKSLQGIITQAQKQIGQWMLFSAQRLLQGHPGVIKLPLTIVEHPF